ncbi:hypothetical protein [Tepidibacter aestuarii]|uniref:hypothetical protein n=1 Tax=Tepidibacter aestuarii TaxID=2925782 RepID=UPI0020BEF84E|nr:hypothetical protein [Tepidibacter aestuarii]CAH2212074.1 protein of unknown function [Tepidibacter aestuarii]
MRVSKSEKFKPLIVGNSIMGEVQIKNRKIIIRKAVKSDANELVNYLNSVSKESDCLTFGEGV